ncbi:MAG: DUF6115 domain-containing protein [Lachnospiraceae bacterium]
MTEVLLLVLGIIIFVASFVIPEKKRAMKEEDRGLGEKQIRELVEEQMQEAKERVSDMVDETITYAVEKTERSMERLSNEKIMAMNEYSDTVLETIHKSHEEAVFLYDMLSDKQETLKETVSQAELRAKEVKEAMEEHGAEKQSAGKRGTGKRKTAKRENVGQESEKQEPAEKKTEEKSGFTPLAPETVTERPVNEEEGGDNTAEKKAPEIALSFAQTGESGKNNNEEILALHKEGKSNMAIARELGLGIGEVKLVIDLYKGM